MEYGRLVVLGYSSYRVERRQRSGSVDQAPPSFGLADASSSDDNSDGSRSSPSPPDTRKRSLGQLWKPLGDQNDQFALEKRPRANGIRLGRFHHVTPTVEAAKSRSHGVSKDLKGITSRMMQRIERRGGGSGNQMDGATARNAEPFLMCVPMNDKDAFASVTEFHQDFSVDMFQIGRMPCRQNDFVIPGPRVGASGTISRYAARILCSREPPFECRIFAGGFDAARRMSTAGHALKYCARCGAWMKRVPTDHECAVQTLMEQASDCSSGDRNLFRRKRSSSRLAGKVVKHYVDDTTEDGPLEHFELDVRDASELPVDGLTKNGVRVWLPEYKQWFEVSVNGNLYAIEARSAESSSNPLGSQGPSNGTRRKVVHSRSGAFNRPTGGVENLAPILTDGAIIDLGGVQLQFQSSFSSNACNGERGMSGIARDIDEFLEAPVVYGRGTLSSVSTQLDRLNVQCPVQLHTLRFTRAAPGEDIPLDQIPHVFPACGHVFGYESRIASSHTCPLCRTPGSLVQLLLKENSQLQSAEEQHAIPECVFNPCGHAISRKLALHYSTLRMPNGRSICPFCAVHLDVRVPFSRLFLYCDSD